MKIFIVICAFLFSLSTAAQEKQKEIFLGARIGHLKMDDYTARNYVGLELDIKYANNLGIQYSMLAGKNYFHMPVGPPAGFLLGLIIITTSRASKDSTKTGVGLGVVLGILTTLIPESVSYNIGITKKVSICPYVSPLQLDFLKNKSKDDGSWSAGLGAGSRVHLYFNDRKTRVSPYFEYKMHYRSDTPTGYTFGLNLAKRL